jgi:hypothetical protein
MVLVTLKSVPFSYPMESKVNDMDITRCCHYHFHLFDLEGISIFQPKGSVHHHLIAVSTVQEGEKILKCKAHWRGLAMT